MQMNICSICLPVYVNTRIVPHVGTITTMNSEIDIIGMWIGPIFKYKNKLMLAAI